MLTPPRHGSAALAATALGVGIALLQSFAHPWPLTIAWALAACADGMQKLLQRMHSTSRLSTQKDDDDTSQGQQKAEAETSNTVTINIDDDLMMRCSAVLLQKQALLGRRRSLLCRINVVVSVDIKFIKVTFYCTINTSSELRNSNGTKISKFKSKMLILKLL